MISVTFKNVGQGDSIILSWEDENDITKYAIIDCKSYNHSNPVIDHIKNHSIKEIEFIILSHPHFDHYSGMLELLEYCESNGIQMKYFLHTCTQNPDYIKTAVASLDAKRELQLLFTFLRQLHSQSKLKLAFLSSGTPNDTIPLNNSQNIFLKLLSPTTVEYDKYVQRTALINPQEHTSNNPNANWLSTIFSIYSEDWYLLLTSDCEKYSLKRIDKEHSDLLAKKLLLGQSPHHGADGNHSNAFWKKRNSNNSSVIVFSVGHNNYNHPSRRAVDFFHRSSFRVYSTNEVGGLLTFPLSSTAKKTSQHLDVFSLGSNLKNNQLNGDKVFKIDDGQITLA